MADHNPHDREPATSAVAPDDSELDGVDRIQRAWARERPGTPVDSIGVITRIWRIGKILDDDRRRTLSRLGIDAATLDLLSTLRRAGPPYRLAPGALARLSLVSAGAVSQRVARAEQSLLVRRTKPAGDGRSVLVELTDAGHALLDRVVDDLLCHEETLLDGLTGAQRTDLAALLRILLGDLVTRFALGDRPEPSPDQQRRPTG